MEAKHTPRQWQVKSWQTYDRNGAIEACGYRVVECAPDGSETGVFCSAIEGDDLSDLYLIAAAREMLQALNTLLPLLDTTLAESCYVPGLREATERARAAAAKATKGTT